MAKVALLMIFLAVACSSYDGPRIAPEVGNRMMARTIDVERLTVSLTLASLPQYDSNVPWPVPWSDHLRAMTVGPMRYTVQDSLSLNRASWQRGFGTSPFVVMNQGRVHPPPALRER